MSVTLFKKVDYSLSKLIHDIEHGDIGLPDIQRPFVWKPTQVRDLFDSMYKGFPVGYLLFWANHHFDNTRQIGTDTKQVRISRLLIVDGQQRLTSLFAVLRGIPICNSDYQSVNIQISFRPRDAMFEVADAAIRRDPEYIPDISTIWANGGTSYTLIRKFFDRWIPSLDHDITPSQEEAISRAIDRLYDLQNYPFTAMEIDASVNEEQVADIFVRINSKGVQLRQADFILTLLSVFWDDGRAALEQFSRQSRQPSPDGSPSPFNYFIQPAPDQLLRASVAVGFKRARLQHVYSLLRGKDLDTGEFSDERRIKQFEILTKAQANVLNLENWHSFLRVLMRAGFRSKDMITSEVGLMYAYAMFLIGKQEYGVEPFKLRNVMARWFFMTSITGRYTGSPESILDGDLARLRGFNDAEGFMQTLDRIVEGELTNDFWEITLPNNLETSSARNPYLFAYYAALNLLNARVLFSHVRISELLDPALNAHRSSVERHHLFPKAYLSRFGYDDVREINQIANYALIEWIDNVRINDQPPSYYFPKYAERFSKEEMRQMMWWHALPDRWYDMDYLSFLAERRRLIAEVTRQGFFTLLNRTQDAAHG